MKKRILYGAVCLGTIISAVSMMAEEKQLINLAHGAEVRFLPNPTGGSENKVSRISRALTDGKHSQAKDLMVWRDPEVAVWKYTGRINMQVDLGQNSHIDEVAVRLLGGSYEWGGQGKGFPTEVDVFVSDDGEQYFHVARYSRWEKEDQERFGVPRDEGVSWMHNLKFEDLKTHGRYVGIRIYGTGLSATDEIQVMGKRLVEGEHVEKTSRERGDFSVDRAQVYFHRPAFQIATNVILPVPIGILTPNPAVQDNLVVELELPEGVELVGGTLGKQNLKEAVAAMGDRKGSVYRFEMPEEVQDRFWNNRKHFGRLYVRATGWSEGQEGNIRLRFGDGDSWESPNYMIPVTAVELVEAPRLEKIMTSLGWWYVHDSLAWPDVLGSLRNVGLNTFAYTVSSSTALSADDPGIQLVEQARERGFYVSLVDSTIQRLKQRHSDKHEMFCQFEGGEVGNAYCPSYRGRYWEEELERFAEVVGKLRPNFISQDIEIWPAADRLDFDFSHLAEDKRRCIRCAENFRKSGIKSPAIWRRTKGLELWTAMIETAKKAARDHGGPEFLNGGYNFRPGQTYQNVWNFDMLYRAGLLDHSQVSTYTTMYPRHIGWIGDRIRADREKILGGSVMPWLTPGDAGVYPGEYFLWMVLEAWTNGARGIWFWSHRMWDSDLLIAHNRAVHAIAPVETIVVDGELIGDLAQVIGKGRVSGMRNDGECVLLVADYEKQSDGVVEVRVTVDVESEVWDLVSGQKVVSGLSAGVQRIQVDLQGEMGRLLWIRPMH